MKGKGRKEIKTVGREKQGNETKGNRKKNRMKKKDEKNKIPLTRIRTRYYSVSYLLTQQLRNTTPHAECM